MSNSAVSQRLIEEFCQLTADIEWNVALTQGTGGNSSVKDEQHMVIKASGTRLSDITATTGYSVLMRQREYKSVASPLTFTQYARPSIEWPLHLACPSKCVLHLHTLSGIVVGLIMPLETISTADFTLVPYADPGDDILRVISNLRVWSNSTKSVFLRNHGVLAWGDSISECRQALSHADTVALRVLGISPKNHQSLIDLATTGLINNSLAFSKTLDTNWLEFVSTNVLFPDQMVFLGDVTLTDRVDKYGYVNLSGLSDSQRETVALLFMLGCLVNPDMCVSRIPLEKAKLLAQTEVERHRKQVG